MKKIVSLMALCAVLLGAVMMVAGCGKKPGSDSVTLAKGTVWEITSEEGKGAYYCFHSDGHLYQAFEVPTADGKKVLKKMDLGTYSFDSKNITLDGISKAYTLKGDMLTVNKMVMKKVSSPTADQIKNLPTMTMQG